MNYTERRQLALFYIMKVEIGISLENRTIVGMYEDKKKAMDQASGLANDHPGSRYMVLRSEVSYMAGNMEVTIYENR